MVERDSTSDERLIGRHIREARQTFRGEHQLPEYVAQLLWGERSVRSVANPTRRDGEESLTLAPRVPVQTETTTFSLEEASRPLDTLRGGGVRGAAVLVAGRTRQ